MFPLFFYVFPWFPMFFYVFSLILPIFPCFSTFSPVFPCFSTFSPSFPCFSQFFLDSPCFPLFFYVLTPVFPCFSTFSPGINWRAKSSVKLTLILYWCKFQIGVLNSVTLQILMIVTRAVKIPLTLNGFFKYICQYTRNINSVFATGLIVSVTIITFT